MLDYLGLVQSLPIEWKSRQRTKKNMNPIIHPNIPSTVNQKQGNQYITTFSYVISIMTQKKYLGVRLGTGARSD